MDFARLAGRGRHGLTMRSLLALWSALLAVGTVSAANTPCVFCEIAAGRATATEICRERDVLAFLDHSPRNPGHVLVVPLAHAENLLEVPPATLAHMAELAQRLARALRATDLRTDGLQLLMNTGRPAGQSVFHAHLHLIPRYDGEPESPAGVKRPVRSPEELEPVAVKLRAALAAQAAPSAK